MPVKFDLERSPAPDVDGVERSVSYTSKSSRLPRISPRSAGVRRRLASAVPYVMNRGALERAKVEPAERSMSAWKKFGIGAGAAALLGGGLWLVVWQLNKGVATVQTAPTSKQDLTSIVTASGEVKPLTYTNVLGEGMGKITSIAVREGDHVKKGDVLLRLESVQPTADVAAQRAGISAAEAGVKSADANDVSAQADIKSRAADLEHAKLDWDRGQQLFKAGLIPK